jgi:hypothetical protein
MAHGSSGELDGASLVAGVIGQALRQSFRDLDGTLLIAGSPDWQCVTHLEISTVHRSSQGSRRYGAHHGGRQTGSASDVWRSRCSIDHHGGLGGTTLVVEPATEEGVTPHVMILLITFIRGLTMH